MMSFYPHTFGRKHDEQAQPLSSQQWGVVLGLSDWIPSTEEEVIRTSMCSDFPGDVFNLQLRFMFLFQA
jgi:hypothetical protein